MGQAGRRAYWGLDDKGVPVRGGEKHAYGISFAIYAACGEYQATHDARALDLAKRAYRGWTHTRTTAKTAATMRP